MINSLTDKQVAQFAIYREKWLSIGLNTEPTDIPAAEAAIKLCYKLAGLAEPKLIICTDSPLDAFLNEQAIVGNNVVNSACINVLSKVKDQVWDKVFSQVSYQVADHVHFRLCDYEWRGVHNHVSSQVQHQTNTTYDITFKQGFYGCHDAYPLSFYDYFREVCGLTKETEKLTGLIALAKCCGWWTPYKDVVIIQHRPCSIHFDDRKRLHCENGMAIKYKDGFGVWVIHGFSLDEQIVIKPHEQTIKQIRDEGNAEKKRIRIERFGWQRYLNKINAKVIDNRYNNIENTYETLVRTPDGMIILLPTCKTGRLFALEVPSEISSCEQAQNWLHSGSQLDTIVGKTRVVGRS